MNRKEYMKEYKEKNRIKLREYKKLWNRNQRAGLKTKLTVKDKPRKNRILIKKGHCENCSILLTSNYAIGGNDRFCGSCLEKSII